MTQQEDLIIEEYSYLLGRTGAMAGHKIIIDRDYLLIGRDPKSCHHFIRESVISRRHAALETDERGDVTITDLGSTNGTFVNGEAIRKRKLEDGDGINFGRDGTLSFIYHKPAGSSRVGQNGRQFAPVTGIMEEPSLNPARQALTGSLDLTTPPVDSAESPSSLASVTTKQCPNCNGHIRAKARYCMHCGFSL